MSDEIELSVEETNKLRAQIGLPLLPVEKPPLLGKPALSSKQELSIEETNKLRASLGLRPIVVEETSKEVKEDVKKVKEPSKPTLKEYSVDTSGKLFYNDAGSDWLDKVGKAKKEKREEAVAAEEDASVNGLSVGHSAQALAEVQEGDIFTLEDQNVLNEEDNERIVNEKLSKSEKLRHEEAEKRKLATLKFGIRFEEDEEEEPAEFAQVSGSTILLDQTKKVEEVPKSGTTKAAALFDDLDEPKPAAAKFKKKSKKSKRLSKKRELANDEELEVHQPMVTESLKFDEEEDGDDGIQQVLAKNREKQQKKRKLLTPEQLAQEIQLHQRIDMREKTGGIVFDDTSEFLNSIGQKEEKEEKALASEEEKEDAVEAADGEPAEEKLEETKPDEVDQKESTSSSTPKFGSMAATLSYLRGNNMVDSELIKQKEARKQQEQRVKEAELLRISISIEERTVKQELALDQSYTRLSKEEQDATFDRILNERLVSKGLVELPKDRYASRKPQDRLSTYNPDVQLRYKDEQGNELDQKQAFKQLSHKYHGTAPKHKKKKVGHKSEAEHVV